VAADPSLSRAEALRQSMLAVMKEHDGASFSYGHPLFWAPYALVGDGSK
jgi:CHAT domain-containing protein